MVGFMSPPGCRYVKNRFEAILAEVKISMQQWFYKFMIRLSQRWGSWIFVLLARGIAAGYYLFFPKRVIIGARFYRALFPGKSGLFHLGCTFKQFQNFTTVFFDRYRLQQIGPLAYDFDGWRHLRRAMVEKNGGILLMSHMGNWAKTGCPGFKTAFVYGPQTKRGDRGVAKKKFDPARHHDCGGGSGNRIPL